MLHAKRNGLEANNNWMVMILYFAINNIVSLINSVLILLKNIKLNRRNRGLVTI